MVICELWMNFWSHEPAIEKVSIFHELFFPKYVNFEIIGAGHMCLLTCLEWKEWDEIDWWKKKIMSNVLACFKLCCYTLTLKFIKHCMYILCIAFYECKYSFKLKFLWRKLEFYTRVYKNDVFFVLFYIIESETFMITSRSYFAYSYVLSI